MKKTRKVLQYIYVCIYVRYICIKQCLHPLIDWLTDLATPSQSQCQTCGSEKNKDLVKENVTFMS